MNSAFRRTLVLALTIASGLAAHPAAALALSDKWTLSGQIGGVSDYRYRGLSLSDKDPAAQGGLTLGHASGFYAGTWASTIAETAGGADVELDLLTGYTWQASDKLSINGAFTYYTYPSDADVSYAEVSASASYSYGAVTPTVGIAYAPQQGHMRDASGDKKDNVYLYGGMKVAIPNTPVSVDAQLGYEAGYFDARANGGKWDWRLGASLLTHGLTFGLAYVDNNTHLIDGHGHDLARGAVVASAGLSF